MAIIDIPTGNLPYEVVDKLPEQGEENKIYGVPVEEGSPYYNDYRYHNGAWEEVDLDVRVFGFLFADYQESVSETVTEMTQTITDMQTVIDRQAQKILELEEVVFPDDKTTVLYENGTLVINELSASREGNMATFGSVVAEYPPLDSNNGYVFKSAGDQPWVEKRKRISQVMFGSLTCPTSMDYWFQESEVRVIDWQNFKGDENQSCRATFARTKIRELSLPYMPKLKSIHYICRGCENLHTVSFQETKANNVSLTTDAFQGCYNLLYVHLVGLEGIVESCERMFANVANDGNGNMPLERIYSDGKLDFSHASNSGNMFRSCKSITGGVGTKFDAEKIDKTYARIDAVDNPGYFTEA